MFLSYVACGWTGIRVVRITWKMLVDKSVLSGENIKEWNLWYCDTILNIKIKLVLNPKML